MAHALSTPSPLHAMFAQNVYAGEGTRVPPRCSPHLLTPSHTFSRLLTGEGTRVSKLLAALPTLVEADGVAAALKKAKQQPSAEQVHEPSMNLP